MLDSRVLNWRHNGSANIDQNTVSKIANRVAAGNHSEMVQ